MRGKFRLGATIALSLCVPLPAFGQTIEGEWVKIRASRIGERMVAKRFEVEDPRDDPRRVSVGGQIEAVDRKARTVRIGPFSAVWDEDSRFKGLEASELAEGLSVRGKGKHDGAGGIIIDSIKPGDSPANTVRVVAVVTQSRVLKGGETVLSLAGVEITLPDEVYRTTRSLARRPDDRRPVDQLTIQLMGRDLIIGGELGSEARVRGNFRLRSGDEDDEIKVEQELQLELLYLWSPSVIAFFEGKVSYEIDDLQDGADRDFHANGQRGLMWLYVRGWPDRRVSFQLGRQNIFEPREWWWDEDLDSFRLYWDARNVFLETAFAAQLVSWDTDGLESRDEAILRWFGHAVWSPRDELRIDGFVLAQTDASGSNHLGQKVSDFDQDEIDADLVWFGSRISGEHESKGFGEVEYWLDLAGVTGEETTYEFDEDDDENEIVTERFKNAVGGWAFDLGATWETELPANPAVTLSYAYGSGNKRGSREAGFRQTGIQDNNTKFTGVTRLRYYGELLRPTLANLSITTAAIGFRFFEASSIDLLYHYYRQDVASDSLREARLKASPTGIGKTIGHEWNVVLGLEEWKHVDIELVAGVFRSGAAFGRRSGKFASLGMLKIDYNF